MIKFLSIHSFSLKFLLDISKYEIYIQASAKFREPSSIFMIFLKESMCNFKY